MSSLSPLVNMPVARTLLPGKRGVGLSIDVCELECFLMSVRCPVRRDLGRVPGAARKTATGGFAFRLSDGL
jgi:hypothetical protein